MSTLPETSNSVAYSVLSGHDLGFFRTAFQCAQRRRCGLTDGIAHFIRLRREDHQLPGGRIDDRRSARLAGGELEAHPAPVLAGLLRDRRRPLQLHARAGGIQRRAIGGPPAGVRHLVGGAHRAGARRRHADRQGARIARAALHACQVALKRNDLLVDRALLHRHALDRAVRIGAALAQRLEHRRDRLRIDGGRTALLAFRHRIHAGEEIAHQLGGLDLHFELGLPVAQRLDLAFDLRLARAHRTGARDVAHRDLADADTGVGLYAQRASVEIRRQPGQLDARLADGDLRRTFHGGAAGIKHDLGNATAVLRCCQPRESGGREKEHRIENEPGFHVPSLCCIERRQNPKLKSRVKASPGHAELGR